jgi:hypothetical protein
MRAEGKTTRRGVLRWLCVLGAVSAMTVSAHGADAGPPPATISITFAQVAGGSGGASVPKDYPELATPPFNTYPHYEVASTKTLLLPVTVKSTETLLTGDTFEVTLVDVPLQKVDIVVKSAKGDTLSKGRYTIPPKAGKPNNLYPISVPYKDGNLVVAITAI